MKLRLAAIPLALAACSGKPSTPQGYQGIVELHRRTLGFEVTGRVRQVRFERGQHTIPGDVVAELDDGLERPQREAREADVRAAEAQLDLLRAGPRSEDLRAGEAQLRAAQAAEDTTRDATVRLRKLRASNTIPAAQLEDAEGALRRVEAERQASAERLQALRRGSRNQEVRVAQARTDAAQAALAAEIARLQKFSLVSPVAGVVLERHVEPGEVVQPGTAVLTLGEPQRPYLDVFVPQQELAGLRVLARAVVRTDGEPEPFGGAIESIAQETEFSPRFLFSEKERASLVVRVRISLEDPRERLHAGVPAFAEITRTAEARR